MAIFVLVNLETGNLKTLDFFEGDKSHSTSRVLLKPGKYGIVQMAIGIAVGEGGGFFRSGSSTTERAASLTTTLKGEFKRIK